MTALSSTPAGGEGAIPKGPPPTVDCRRLRRGPGIHFLNTAGRVDDCEIYGNLDAGILVERPGVHPPPLSSPRWHISFVPWSCVAAPSSGGGGLFGLFIMNYASAGSAAANPWINSCSVSDGKGCGIACTDSARGASVRGFLVAGPLQ